MSRLLSNSLELYTGLQQWLVTFLQPAGIIDVERGIYLRLSTRGQGHTIDAKVKMPSRPRQEPQVLGPKQRPVLQDWGPRSRHLALRPVRRWEPGRQTVFGEFQAKNLASSSNDLQELFSNWNIKTGGLGGRVSWKHSRLHKSCSTFESLDDKREREEILIAWYVTCILKLKLRRTSKISNCTQNYTPS